MKFGYFCNPTNPGHKRDYMAVMNEAREIATFCDQNDFHSFWLAEHHFSIWGREILPNPIIMGADIAARTKRLRIGLAAAIITFWHPLRLAEDLALLDQLCDGRLELGLGRGNYGLEGYNLNAIADPRNPEQNFKVFDETLKILKKAFTEPLFSFKGEFYTVPNPGFRWDRAHPVDDSKYIDAETKELTKISVFPQPRQKPHPPLWQVVDSPLAVDYAARNDLGIIMWRPPVETLKERFQLYQRVTKEATGKDIPLGRRCGIMRDCFVANTMAEARTMSEEYVMRYLNWSNWRGPKIFLRPGEVLDPEKDKALVKELTYDFVHERSLLFGTPDYVAEKIEELRDELGIEAVLINSSWSGVPHELTMRSLKLFADKMIPRLRSQPAGIDRAASASAQVA